jgi:hypothetical protein
MLTRTGNQLYFVFLDPMKIIQENGALLKPLKKRGVRRMLPLDCLPLRGREGVTLIIAFNE